MEAAVACVRPAAKAALVVGMGAGTLPRYLLARGIVTDVVEQSSVVVDMAERHFRFARGGQNRSDGATTLVANAESARAFVCAGSHAPRGAYSDMFLLWLCQKPRPCLSNDDSAR